MKGWDLTAKPLRCGLGATKRGNLTDMDVELADERILILADKFSMDHAEGRAWTKRIEAFGTMAKLTGFLARPRDEEFQVVYRERRLQPFWRIGCSAVFAYERAKEYHVPVLPNVQTVTIDGTAIDATDGAFAIKGLEACRDEIHRDVFFDAIKGAADPALSSYMKHDATVADADALAAATANGTRRRPARSQSVDAGARSASRIDRADRGGSGARGTGLAPPRRSLLPTGLCLPLPAGRPRRRSSSSTA